MKYLFKIIILCIFIISCKSEDKSQLSDLNLYFESDVEIDSVFISNITQDREFMFLPYSNVMNIDLNDSINDIYNIDFYTKNGRISNQIWLDGKQIQIKGRISKKAEIDTIIGSNLYYKYKDFSKRYRQILTRSSSDSILINDFLFTELKTHIESPLSIHVTSQILNRNKEKEEVLKKAFNLLSSQSKNLKNHIFNDFKKIQNILTVKNIDFSEQKFHDIENKLSQITLSEGKTYLLDLWFVNCAPCVEDHKRIVTQLDKLKDNNIELIGISTDNDYSKWKSYLEKHHYNWTNYREVENHDDRLRAKMLISDFPTYFLIDDQGKILKRTNRYSDIEKLLK